MARVTVEDCVTEVPNRFELVMFASQRARNISAGASLTVDRDNDKNPVIALREIADKMVELNGLEESLIKGLQRNVEMDEPEEDEVDLIAIQQDLSEHTSGNEPPIVDLDGSLDRDGGVTAMDGAGEILPADDLEADDDRTTADKD